MGTKWILRAVLLLAAVLESLSATSRQQSSKVTTLAAPTSSRASPAKKFNTTRKNTWQTSNSDAVVTPQYDRPPRLAAFSTTISPTPNTIGVYRHAVVHTPHEYFEPSLPHRYAPHSISVTETPANHFSKARGHPLSSESAGDTPQSPTAATFFKISHGPGFQSSNYPLVINHDAYTTHPSANGEITETKAQSRAMIPGFHYQSYNQPTSTLGNYIPPTFAPSLEQNLGKFEPFPPFKYSHTKSVFSGIDAPVNGNRSPNLDFGLGNSNFMLKPHNFYPGSNHRGQVPLFSGSGMNTLYTEGVGKPLEPYQPLSAQPQLHFNHHLSQAPSSSQTFGRINNHGDVANELDINQSGRGGSTQGGRTNPYIAGNFVNTHPMPPFRNIEYSFEVPTSSIFNDYDKTFGKYGTEIPSGGGKESADEQYQHSPASHGNDEGKGEKDEKSEYQSEEATSTSREQYNDEGEGESQRNERRGKNARKREENNTEDKYDKNGGFDYEREFEESYKQELPTEDFEHSEEILDEDESTKTHKRASSSKTRKAPRNQPPPRDREGPLMDQCHEFPSFVRNDDDTESSKGGKKTGLPPRPSSFGRKIPRRRPTRFTSPESDPDEAPQKSRDSQNRKNPGQSSNKKNSSH